MKKTLSIWLMLIAILPALQGCFPIVATGVVGAGLVVADRRSSGIQLEDTEIELRASRAINQKYGDRVHIKTTSYNRVLLLVGEVPDAQARSDVGAIARQVENVNTVVNETTIAGNLSFSERSSDAYLTTKVRTRLFTDSNDRYWPVQISITSEGGVVYLMGLLTHAEADAVADVASTTSGVQRVVKVFEYIAKPPEGEPQHNAETNASQRPADMPDKPVESQAPAPSSEVLPPAQPVK